MSSLNSRLEIGQPPGLFVGSWLSQISTAPHGPVPGSQRCPRTEQGDPTGGHCTPESPPPAGGTRHTGPPQVQYHCRPVPPPEEPPLEPDELPPELDELPLEPDELPPELDELPLELDELPPELDVLPSEPDELPPEPDDPLPPEPDEGDESPEASAPFVPIATKAPLQPAIMDASTPKEASADAERETKVEIIKGLPVLVSCVLIGSPRSWRFRGLASAK
jgi:hypothetical protein